MADKSKAMPMIGAAVVIVIGVVIALWVMGGTETAPPVPPDRGNTEETLPAQPADPAPPPTPPQSQ